MRLSATRLGPLSGYSKQVIESYFFRNYCCDMRRAFKYRLYPTTQQDAALQDLLEAGRRLYNTALEQRRSMWRSHRIGLNYYDQAAQLKEARDADDILKLLNYSACQDILRRLQKSFVAFFRHIKHGETPGYPRFKSADRFNSVTFPAYGDGLKLDGRLHVQNVGSVKIRLHRPVEGTIKTVTLKRGAGKWYAIFSCDDVPPRPYPDASAEVGIDLGLESFATLSTGEKVNNPRWYRKIEKRLAEAQRAVSVGRSKKAKRRMTRLHAKAANQRLDFQQKLAYRLVAENAFIAVEDLQPSEMISDARKGMAKSIRDASWSQFLAILSSKAEEAGRTFIRVAAKGTSSICFQCGAYRKKKLGERVHSCPCGFVMDRDVHASLNILRLGRSLSAFAGEAVAS
jgi:putative transposase